MPFKIIHKKVGIADSLGATTKMYEVDEVIDDNEDWKKDLGQRFVESGNAMYVDAEVVVPMTKGYDDPLATVLGRDPCDELDLLGAI
mgnify:CR=1 FL=1